ncbi:hypothetical protein AUM47_08970 [Cronobacter malonaticus]|nr:hypothetical protein [Cronobacter malonaticus]EGT4371629.1 hypothetical protein [Cronobacter malonaticus]MDI6467540.1 hypothetical protein [Cronobacter malonaticus]HAU5448777.1 hypothetical protein [Cronobacter malonaticus]
MFFLKALIKYLKSSQNEVLAMLARYIVIAIYGLDKFFGKDVIFLVFGKENNSVYNYFESDSEAFECCDELNNKDPHWHILIEAKATYNNNDININSPYIKENDNIIVVIPEYLKTIIEKNDIVNDLLSRKTQLKSHIK